MPKDFGESELQREAGREIMSEDKREQSNPQADLRMALESATERMQSVGGLSEESKTKLASAHAKAQGEMARILERKGDPEALTKLEQQEKRAMDKLNEAINLSKRMDSRGKDPETEKRVKDLIFGLSSDVADFGRLRRALLVPDGGGEELPEVLAPYLTDELWTAQERIQKEFARRKSELN